MKELLRSAAVAALLAGAAGCALIAGIEDFNAAVGDAGDDVVVTNGDGASGETGSALGADGEPFEATVAQDGAAAEGSATDVLAPPDSPVVTEAGGCASACSSGQSCENGECWPQAIATGRNTPRSVIVVNGSVAWVETQVLSSAVVACPATGCSGTPMVVQKDLASPVVRRASPSLDTLVDVDQGSSPARTVTSSLSTSAINQEDHVWGAAVSPGYVLYAARDKVRFCGNPCLNAAQQISYGKTPPTGPAMAVAVGRAYWTPPNGGVMSCDLPTCSNPIAFGDGRTFVDFEVTASGVTALSANALSFYDGAGTETGNVTLATSTALVVAASTVYVATATGIVTVDPTSHAASTRWPASSPRGLATDGAFLYWTEGSSVLRAPN